MSEGLSGWLFYENGLFARAGKVTEFALLGAIFCSFSGLCGRREPVHLVHKVHFVHHACNLLNTILTPI
jgi:hypothetical protein